MTCSPKQMQKRRIMTINVAKISCPTKKTLNHPKIFQYRMLHITFKLLDHLSFMWKSFT